MTDLLLRINGTPAQQGSKRGFVNRKTGRAIVVETNDANKRTWRQDVFAAAGEHRSAHPFDPPMPMSGPLRVGLTFLLRRPVSAPKKRVWPETQPDVDKLARGLLDALVEAGVLEDDKFVIELVATKKYAEASVPPGAVVSIEAM